MARKKDKQEEIDVNTIQGGPGKGSRKMAAFWLGQVTDIEDLYKNWYKRGDQIIRRFRDDRKKAEEDGIRRLSILWANYKVLKPALYGKPPIPIVERRFLQKDPVGRTSSIILERNIRYQMEVNGLHTSIGRAVADYLLSGRGVCWVRYEPEIGFGDSLPPTSQNNVEDELVKIEEEFGEGDAAESEESEKLESTGEQLLSEQAPVDYIGWKDFLMFPARARTWDEVQAIAKRVYISKEEAKERFGEDIAEAMQPQTDMMGDENDKGVDADQSIFHDINERSYCVYEIWNRIDRKVYWISKGYNYLCDVKEDPLKLKKFFPVVEPISATLTNDSLIPVPDYWEYQDQAIQIDEITQRLALLTKACKVAGTYDGSNGALKRLLQEGFENDLLPVDSWAVFAEKGGVKGGISFLPIEEIQKVIDTLQKVKQSLMQDLDLVSGITDVNRGTTDSRETLGGIRLKNNNTGTRLSDRQNEVSRFAKNILELVGEIVAKHFDDKTLIEASGILFDDDMQPKNILEELAPPQAAQQPPQPQIPGMGGPPMPPGMPQGMPQPNPMMGAGGPPMPPGNNVIPFPPQMGGQPPMPPPNPMASIMGGMQQPPMPDPMMIIMDRIEKAIGLLRKDVPRGYRIDIETDSTIFGDAAQERQDATEFITATTQFLGQAATLGETMPEAVPLFGRMLQWGVRKFRVGRDLEGAIDDFVNKMDKKVKEIAKNPKPNPEEMKAQAEVKAQEMENQRIEMQNKADAEKTMREQQVAQATDAREMQRQQIEDSRELQKMQIEDAREREMAQLEASNKMAEANIKANQLRMQALLADRQHANEIEQMNRQQEYDKAAHDMKMEQLDKQAEEKDKVRKDKAKAAKAKPKGKAA